MTKETLIYSKKVLIFGCGNTLFGNDGFGPRVIHWLNENHSLPDHVLALDAGTGIRDYVFDLLLLEDKPECIFVIDAVTVEGKNEGDIFEADLSQVPKQKLSDFSLHQSPSSNLLHQLSQTGTRVRMLCMQTPSIPNEIAPGLSRAAESAVPAAVEWIMNEIKSREL